MSLLYRFTEIVGKLAQVFLSLYYYYFSQAREKGISA